MIELVVLAAASFFGDTELDALLAKAQPDVRAFVERQTSCNHWAGEYAYDADRGRQIDHALRVDHCDRIEADNVRMRRRFAHDPEVMKLLEAVSVSD